MYHTQLLERIRRQVCARFGELGASDEDAVSETILVRDGFYCGRRFERDGFFATWFIAEGELKLHDRSGAVVEVCKPRTDSADAA